MLSPHQTLNLPQSLGNGLVIRLGTPADVEPLAEFNTRIHLEEGEPPNFLRDWTRALMAGRHPTTSPADFVLVEDKGQIVSAAGLIPQVWHYAGRPFGVGRPELVGTDPAYRRQGVMRAIFAQLHALSAAYGHQVQGITGIPWYYRQFGYEYALALGGSRSLRVEDVPVADPNQPDPCQIRSATLADIPALMTLYQNYAADKLITAPLDEARWRYELTERGYAARTCCLVLPSGRVAGAFTASTAVFRESLILRTLIVEPGVSLRQVLPVVARYLKAWGQTYLAETTPPDTVAAKFTTLSLDLGAEHPAYAAFEAKLGPAQRPYAWCMRVSHLPDFIRHLTPVLEQRLAVSVMCGYSGALNLSFYRDGLRLQFDQGRLVEVAAWPPPDFGQDWEGAGFPPLIFWQLLFGYRSLDELRETFPDCQADEEPALLLKALFPKQASWVTPLN